MVIGLVVALGGMVGCGADAEEATFSERASAMRQNNHAPTIDRVEGVPGRRVTCGTKIEVCALVRDPDGDALKASWRVNGKTGTKAGKVDTRPCVKRCERRCRSGGNTASTCTGKCRRLCKGGAVYHCVTVQPGEGKVEIAYKVQDMVWTNLDDGDPTNDQHITWSSYYKKHGVQRSSKDAARVTFYTDCPAGPDTGVGDAGNGAGDAGSGADGGTADSGHADTAYADTEYADTGGADARGSGGGDTGDEGSGTSDAGASADAGDTGSQGHPGSVNLEVGLAGYDNHGSAIGGAGYDPGDGASSENDGLDFGSGGGWDFDVSSGNAGGTPDAGADTGDSADAGGGTGAGRSLNPPSGGERRYRPRDLTRDAPGCACGTTGRGGGPMPLAALVLGGLAVAWRRRRR